MNKVFIPAIALFCTLQACNSDNKNETAATAEKQEVATTNGTEFSLDSTSTIKWAGSKPMATHVGVFKFKGGSFFVENNQVTSGSFSIDMNSIQNEDLTNDLESKNGLEGHLKSPDFFDVAKYPESKFEITAVEPADSSAMASFKDATNIIKGNLTIKDSTKNISFPAKINITEQSVDVAADFAIDRTLWGLNYKGPNNPKDWFIKKEVKLTLQLHAVKK